MKILFNLLYSVIVSLSMSISVPFFALAQNEGRMGSSFLESDLHKQKKTTIDSNPVISKNWEEQNIYWEKNYRSRPYYNKGMPYEKYQPAYQYGVEMYYQHNGIKFDELDQSELRHNWENNNGSARLQWDKGASNVIKDAYNRLYESQNLM